MISMSRIVDGNHVVVDRHSRGPDQNRIAHRVACKLDVAANNVVEAKRLIGNGEAYGERLTGRCPRFRFLGGQPSALA